MPSFGKTSLERLSTCHPKLQQIANELIKEMDVTICCGYRNQEDQEKAFQSGRSKLHYPNSAHNKIPSEAFDVMPYNAKTRDLDFDEDKITDMLCRIERIANCLKIPIRLGRDFKSLGDADHIQLFL